MNYDPELPDGYQDADFDMRELQAKADHNAALRQQGICGHGWQQGYPNGEGTTPGMARCLDCGDIVSDRFEAALSEGEPASRLRVACN